MRGFAVLGQIAGWLFLAIGVAVVFGHSMASGAALMAAGISYLLVAAMLSVQADVLDELRALRRDQQAIANWQVSRARGG